MGDKFNIYKPTPEQVKLYLDKWEKLGNYPPQEEALNKLFHELCPNNTKIEDILLKTAALNDFYSTKLLSTYDVAKHILELNIDNP